MGTGVLSPDRLPPRSSDDQGSRHGGGSDWWRRGSTAGSNHRDQDGIPIWDGSASRWRRYKKDVALWIEGVNLDVNWSWAARMVRNLTGPAKTLGESIPMVELRGRPWTWVRDGPAEDEDGEADEHGDEEEERGHWESPDHMAGINKLMDVLSTMGVDEPTRRGQVMNYFYKQLHRRAGEDLNAWMIRFGEARSQLDEEDVALPPRTAGWWLIEKTGLTDTQKSMLMTSTAGSMELRDVVPAMLRVFPNLHGLERRPDRTFDRSRAPNSRIPLFKKKFGVRRFKEANVTEDCEGMSQLDEDDLEALAMEQEEDGEDEALGPSRSRTSRASLLPSWRR